MGKAESIVAGLGGAANIAEIEPCATRLRTEVHDPAKVDQAALKAAGAYGVLAIVMPPSTPGTAVLSMSSVSEV